MGIWLIRPIDENGDDWTPWYDRCFGFVVSADDPKSAREIAMKSSETGDEGSEVWGDPAKTRLFCLSEQSDYESGIVMSDFHAA